MNYLDLFSGIGGFALGAYWAGIKVKNHYFSEIEPYAVELYKKRFPDAILLGNITNINYEELINNEEWVITGGFPCQPHSLAGKRKGSKDERDLWSYCRETVRVLRPRFAIFENVPGLLSSEHGTFFERILKEMAEIGYNVEWTNISAKQIGARHKRDRIWIVAYSGKIRCKCRSSNREKRFVQENEERNFKKNQSKRNGWKCRTCSVCSVLPNSRNYRDVERFRKLRKDKSNVQTGLFNRSRKEVNESWKWWKIEPDLGRVADGIPCRVDRLKGLGNAIVPQIAHLIFEQIKPYLEKSKTGCYDTETKIV